MESMGEFHPRLAKKNTNAHLKFDKKNPQKKTHPDATKDVIFCRAMTQI